MKRNCLTLGLLLVAATLATLIGCSAARVDAPDGRETAAGAQAVASGRDIRESMRDWGQVTDRAAIQPGTQGGGGWGYGRVGRISAKPSDGSRPSGSEELWIIQKPAARNVERPADDKTPGTGALLAKRDQGEPQPLPLKHTDVKAWIAGYIATTDVTQQYHNPYDQKIEAVYVFPLPQNAAVSEFVMTIGERHIRGIIREREEAQKIYHEARSQGLVASLLTQERPNVFTQSVANIEPGKQIDIHIRYFNTLAYVDGWYEYVFPMVVGPRFNPPGSTDGIGAKAHGSAVGTTGQKTEVSYLKPGERASDISLSVNVDAGVPIERIETPSHQVASNFEQGSPQTKLELNRGDTIPNKDFVLRYQVAGGTIKSAVMTQQKDGQGYFTLMLYPPDSLKQLKRQPLELVFTLDVSGSMSGPPIEQCKAAIRYALQHMDERDTFQIIRFAGGATRMAERPLTVTPANLQKALAFIESTEAGGGTMMREGIRASLDFPHDEGRLRFVSFMTDGYIGNEAEILAEVKKSLGPSRIFSFGVGSSPNRYLLDHLAKLGNGAVAYLPLEEKAQDVMAVFFDRISHPAMTDLTIDFAGLNASEAMPARVPDLFVGRPVIVTGKYAGRGKASVKVTGTVAGQRQVIEIPVDLDAKGQDHAGIASVWARQKIADLCDAAAYDPAAEWAGPVKQTALKYGLMSPFTAFLAVDSTARTAGDHGTTVAVPVPVPQGVKYETTVKE